MVNRSERIGQAQEALRALNFDAERCNERSALVLLALLDLGPGGAWKDAESPMLRTVEIMDWLREHYDKDYKPNTRETIRRQTLHQFVDAGLVVLNPDEPTRPVNSPRNCYQVEPAALALLRMRDSKGFERALKLYLVERPGLVARYACERQQDVDEQTLGELGVQLDKHGKFPDLIVYLPDRHWLVLMEAASSHGPVDAKRHGELSALFGSSSAGLVFVSCFPSRAEMRKYLNEIAWETDVWCADAPSHLIHFNGERFLGPYDGDL